MPHIRKCIAKKLLSKKLDEIYFLENVSDIDVTLELEKTENIFYANDV